LIQLSIHSGNRYMHGQFKDLERGGSLSSFSSPSGYFFCFHGVDVALEVHHIPYIGFVSPYTMSNIIVATW
jgi:hypothetical protein